MPQFVLDHEYAGDCAALGVEYRTGDNDYEIIVTVDRNDRLIDMIHAVAEYEVIF